MARPARSRSSASTRTTAAACARPASASATWPIRPTCWTCRALAGVRVWIVDALRDTPHPTHAHVAKALDWIATVRPERAILTNLHVDLDYNELRGRLPPGVEPAYDGMRLEVAV